MASVGVSAKTRLQQAAAAALAVPAAATSARLPARPLAGLSCTRRAFAAPKQRSMLTITAKAVKQAESENVAAEVEKSKGERIKGIVGLAAVGLTAAVAAAGGGVWIDTFSTLPCQLTPEGCTAIPTFMKVPLVGAHMFTFCLIPATMYVFYTRSQALKASGAQDPFTSMVGLSFLQVAIAGEIGWHVTQDWFYVEDYSILNFFFYFFLMLGTSLWTIGIKEDDTTTSKDEYIDYFLLATPVLAGAFYMLGAAVTHTKLPIYLLLSVQYAVLTYRFWNLLDTWKVFLFPLFSVGVNLAFIAALNANQKDPILNPLFHILHDAAGTELGVAIIASLIYLQLPANTEGPRLK